MHYAIRLVLLGLLMIAGFPGCTSFKTNFLFRSEDNSHWEKEKHLKGVPVTLKVPTHVRIDVLEKRYMFLGVGNKGVRNIRQQYPMRAVEYTTIETEKIFLVDLKRAGAGNIKTNIDMDADQQYFNEITNHVEDTTIDAISDILGQIAPSGLIGAPTSEDGEGAPAAFGRRIKEVTSVVASKVFEFDAPDFEIQVSQFLCDHLNRCHICKVDDVPLGLEADSAPANPDQTPTDTDPGLAPVVEPVETSSSLSGWDFRNNKQL